MKNLYYPMQGDLNTVVCLCVNCGSDFKLIYYKKEDQYVCYKCLDYLKGDLEDEE